MCVWEYGGCWHPQGCGAGRGCWWQPCARAARAPGVRGVLGWPLASRWSAGVVARAPAPLTPACGSRSSARGVLGVLAPAGRQGSLVLLRLSTSEASEPRETYRVNAQAQPGHDLWHDWCVEGTVRASEGGVFTRYFKIASNQRPPFSLFCSLVALHIRISL